MVLMRSPFLIATDAAALGGAAAYGGVIEDADGERYEVYGLIQRTALQEVTAALAVLRSLPHDAEGVLQVDAQLTELQSVLVITHPHLTATQVPRNSSPQHERAHELARAALRQGPTVSRGEHQKNRVAVFAVAGVKTVPKWAVAYEVAGTIKIAHGYLPKQSTKGLTLALLRDAALAATPTSHTLIAASSAHPQQVEGESSQTLSLLRSAVSKAIAEAL